MTPRLKYLSVCSGIEAASVAWTPLGWEPLAFSEIEPFPSAVLAHHYPDVPNLGDMTAYGRWPALAPDLLVGGTPCQSFSVAGLRAGLADPRGNLALVFLGVVDRYRPRWVVWENVPGVRSSTDGRDLGAFLGGLAELGYGWAYRSLDAQYFGLAQRRERVFVVAHLGDWRPPAAVLFEPESLSGDSAPSRATGERIAACLAPGAHAGGVTGREAETDGVLIAHPLRAQANASHRADSDTYVTHALRADGFNASEDGTGRGTLLVAVDLQQITSKVNRSQPSPQRPPLTTNGDVVAFGWQNSDSQGDSVSEHVTPSLDKSKTPAVALAIRGREGGAQMEMGDEVANAILTPNGGRGGIGVGATLHGMAVRRLTPRECERLQGFPDDYTLVPYRSKPAADGPRYKALGNSMATPVVRWLGQRIALVAGLAPAPQEEQK